MDANLLIDRYTQASGQLRPAIADLSRPDLLARPVPNTWSIQQIILHLMDSDLIWTDRAKRMIAETNPLIIGYDEKRFSTNLFYDEQDVGDAVTIFELNRRQFARVLRRLPPETFNRQGVHNERGIVRLGESIEGITWHVGHHLKFVQEKRKLLGK